MAAPTMPIIDAIVPPAIIRSAIFQLYLVQCQASLLKVLINTHKATEVTATVAINDIKPNPNNFYVLLSS